jgi:hypothetical protein
MKVSNQARSLARIPIATLRYSLSELKLKKKNNDGHGHNCFSSQFVLIYEDENSKKTSKNK